VCFLYRDLDYVSQRPMYVSFEDGEVTSACQVNDIACVTISNFHSWGKNLYGHRRVRRVDKGRITTVNDLES